VISTIIVRGGIACWSNILTFLSDNLDPNQDTTIIENSIQAITIIIEDSQEIMAESHQAKTVEYMMPKIFQLIDPAQSEFVKDHAMFAINMLLMGEVSQVKQHAESYGLHLLKFNNDKAGKVKNRAIQGITSVMECSYKFVIDNF